jgi:hypothetical protein
MRIGGVERFRREAQHAVHAVHAVHADTDPLPASNGRRQRRRLNGFGNHQLDGDAYRIAVTQAAGPACRGVPGPAERGRNRKEAVRSLKATTSPASSTLPAIEEERMASADRPVLGSALM